MPEIMTAIGTDATNTFEDLSGITNKKLRRKKTEPACSTGASLSGSPNGNAAPNRQAPDANNTTVVINAEGEEEEVIISNPYDILIEACEQDPSLIQTAYQTHRQTRNSLQKKKILAPGFPGVTVDGMLSELVKISPARDRLVEKEEIDPRHCLVFWAKPPGTIRSLVGDVQRKLVDGLKELDIGDLWLMPSHCLHMTVLEITHSTTSDTITSLIDKLTISQLSKIVSYPQSRSPKTRLVKPMLSFDAAALAVSFLPADTDTYTYHHLRRDMYNLVEEGGINIDSRYIVPSAHITIGRFISPTPTTTEEEVAARMHKYVTKIEEINLWLDQAYEELGWEIDTMWCNRGRLWYGGGETVASSP